MNKSDLQISEFYKDDDYAGAQKDKEVILQNKIKIFHSKILKFKKMNRTF